MPTDLQIALWGLAVTVPVLLNIFARSSSDALGLSGMLLLIWVMGRVLGALYTPPESMSLYPLIDALAGATTFSAWLTRPRQWKGVLTALFVAQCALHAAFWLAWPEPGSLLRYLWVNNSLFILQLLCVATPGGVHVALCVRDWLSHRPRAGDHARA